jgi:quercetin dioxygenase-like cupin family protein
MYAANDRRRVSPQGAAGERPATALSSFLRSVDVAGVSALPKGERFVQRLIDLDSGATSCAITYVRTPPGGRSPRGRHTHAVDQHIYVVSGTMNFDVDGECFEGGEGALVYFPAWVPHENWNPGTEPTIHLSITAPLDKS